MNKSFKKRLLGFLIIDIYSEFRTVDNQKHFIKLAFIHSKLVFFELVFRTGIDALYIKGFYTYFGKLQDDAMKLEEIADMHSVIKRQTFYK